MDQQGNKRNMIKFIYDHDRARICLIEHEGVDHLVIVNQKVAGNLGESPVYLDYEASIPLTTDLKRKLLEILK